MIAPACFNLQFIGLLALFVCKSAAFQPLGLKASRKNNDVTTSLHHHTSVVDSFVDNTLQEKDPSRRKLLTRSIGTLVVSPALWASHSMSASAVQDIATLDEQSKRFRRVPVFAIVDGKTGIPFMILQNTGTATGYFFTSFEGASLVLEDAKKDAAGNDLSTQELWSTARISAVTMEFALKLQKGRPKATAQNGQKYGTVFDIISTVTDLEDAGKMDKSGIYTERGRVPLFFIEEFQLEPEKEGGEKRTPVFFRKVDLLREFSKKNPQVEDVNVYVVDLIDTFSAMIGQTNGQKLDSKFMNSIVFIPSKESRQFATDCEKQRGDISAYKAGEMIAVGGK